MCRYLFYAAISLPLLAQPRGGNRQAFDLDLAGKTAEARALLQKDIDSAASPKAKAAAQRNMAMSWAFDGNCKKTGDYEQLVIDYWRTREKDDPSNAFYQEGEMANEAARVCIEAGDFDAAERWYQMGHDLGMREPGISADRAALWDFRLTHAKARLAARRDTGAEALKNIAAAKAALDRMTTSRKQQDVFLPYLTGYVALYLGDYPKALADLQQASQSDPFIQSLIAQTYEKLGEKDKALEYYRKASATTAHNPPAAYARPLARSKLQ